MARLDGEANSTCEWCGTSPGSKTTTSPRSPGSSRPTPPRVGPSASPFPRHPRHRVLARLGQVAAVVTDGGDMSVTTTWSSTPRSDSSAATDGDLDRIVDDNRTAGDHGCPPGERHRRRPATRRTGGLRGGDPPRQELIGSDRPVCTRLHHRSAFEGEPRAPGCCASTPRRVRTRAGLRRAGPVARGGRRGRWAGGDTRPARARPVRRRRARGPHPGRTPSSTPRPGSARPPATTPAGPARRRARRCAPSPSPTRSAARADTRRWPPGARTPRCPAQSLGPVQRRQAPSDEEVVPSGPVLVEEQHRRSRRTDPGPQTRRLDLHQRHEAVDLGLVHQELGQDPTQTKRVLAQRRARPVVARGGRVPLVEHEIEHLEHRRQAGVAVGSPRVPRTGHWPPTACAWPERSAGPRWTPARGMRAAISSVVRPPRSRSVSATRRLGGQDGVTRDEDEPQQVVAEIVVGLVEIDVPSPDDLRPHLGLADELVLFALEHRPAPQQVDGASLADGHEPRPGVVGDARRGPRLQRRGQASWARSSPTPTSPT